jgi:uncharacterized protein (DUF427 family)
VALLARIRASLMLVDGRCTPAVACAVSVQGDRTMRDRGEFPAWVLQARAGWKWRGARRPPFAVEPRPGEESVWDYPRPPLLVRDTRHVVVRLGSIVVAESRSGLRLLETSHPPTWYVPRVDVASPSLARASGGSFCEWKGQASYFDVVGAGGRVSGAAWSYEAPIDEAFAALAGAVAFYATELECLVDGERVRPQPGGFYGGWITKELVGPFKGEPGTSEW